MNAQRRRVFRLILSGLAVAFTTGALFGCGKTRVPPDPLLVPTPDGTIPEAADLPLRLNDAIWDPDTGERLRIAQSEYAWPPPETDPRIAVDGTSIARVGRWRTDLKKPIGALGGSRFVIAERKNRIVVAASYTELVSLDFTTGALVTSATGQSNARLFIDHDGERILTLDTSTAAPRWLIARRADDLRELWRRELPAFGSPFSIEQVGSSQGGGGGDTVVVRASDWTSFVALRDGTQRFIFRNEQFHFAAPIDERGMLISTEKRLAAFDLDGTKRWERPPLGDAGTSNGGALVLPNRRGTLLFAYGEGSDSNVDLVLLNPANGFESYRVSVERFGIRMHSEYYHSAFVRLRAADDVLDVVSVGSGGTVVETRNASTGKQIKRWKPAMPTF